MGGKEERRTVELPGLTLEVALYLLLVVVAAAMRLYGLGERPLQEMEAEQAMAAWRFYRGEAQGLAPGHSPLLFHGNAFLFALFGANDYIARLVPALFGTMLVGLPYFLRRRLGRTGALAASFLFAFSPSFLLFSRSLDPEVIVAACSLAMLIGLLGYLDYRKRAYLRLTAAALAIALSAGSSAYTALLVFGSFLAFTILLDRSGLVAAWREARSDRALLRDCAILLVVIFLFICTGLLANFQGVQAGIDLAATWLARFRPQADHHPWHYYLRLLLSYEGLALVLGLSGAGYFLLKQDLFSNLLAYWFAASMLLNTIARGKSPAFTLQSLLPLVLLAGKLIGEFFEGKRKTTSKLEGAFLSLSLATMVYVTLQLGGYATFGQAIYLKAALGAVVVLIGLFALWAWLGRGRALRTGGLALSLFLAALMVHTTFNLNYHHGHEPLIGVATSPDVVEMVRAIERVSSDREGDRHSIAIAVDESLEPTLAWYLRGFEEVGFSSAIGPYAPIVIVPAEGEHPPLGGYIGQRFRLRASWGLDGLRGASLVRWFLYREATTPVRYDEVILYSVAVP